MEFGEKLKQIRKERGLTQVQLAEKAGISYGAIVNYENGRRKEVQGKILLNLAKALDVQPKDLMPNISKVEIKVEPSPEFLEALQKEKTEKLERLSDFLLAGDNVQDAYELLQIYSQLNDIGKNRIMDYARDMKSISKYCKTDEQLFPKL